MRPGAIVLDPLAPKPVSVVSITARGGDQDHNHRDNRQGTRGGARADKSCGRLTTLGRGAQSHFYVTLMRATTEASNDVITSTLLYVVSLLY